MNTSNFPDAPDRAKGDRAVGAARPPAWAGQFYPGKPDQLRRAVEGYLTESKTSEWRHVKALIAPHAGYIYSGPIAGSAFRHFLDDAATIRRIILLGPSHRVPFYGLAMSSAPAYASPLGEVSVDRECDKRLSRLPQVQILDEAHAGEHCLEVELPFLQQVLPSFSFVPLVVGDATPQEIAGVLDELWGGPETRIVVSSDLSHYLPYSVAQTTDQETAQAVESLDVPAIQEHQACGHIPVRGLLHAARKHGLQAHTVDLRNSGDTAGSRDRVVGYGAFVFC